MREMMAAVLSLALFGLAACSGEPAGDAKVERASPLKDLPSAPGPTVEKIKALGDNAWLNLGSPAPDPKWGKGRGRSWGCKMPYAPDLGGAFLSGQGVHGYVAPDGRYDDIFFYDLYAHRWICIYPGINTRTFVEDIKNGAFKVNDDGQVADKDGQPIYGIGAHSYQSQTYDTDLRKWVTSSSWGGLPGDQHCRAMPWLKESVALLAAQMQGKTDKVSGTPYFFNTVTGKLERFPADGPRPAGGTLFYLPTRKLLWQYAAENKTWFGDPATRKWSPAGAKGPTPPGIPGDVGACYDSKRDRLYLGRGPYGGPVRDNEGHVYIYDVKTNAWSNPPNKENAVAFPATNYGVVNYDAANDRVVALSHWEGKGGVSAYDPETGAWETLPPPPAGFLSDQGCIHGFYSPEVNAHFFYLAHDSDDRGTMWAYRYKPTPAPQPGR